MIDHTPDCAIAHRLRFFGIFFLAKMDRGFFLAVAVLAVLVNFIQGSAEDKPNVMRRTSLLEKLGMELHR